MRLAEKTSFIPDPMASADRPSKMIKLDNRTLPMASLNLYNANGSTPPQPPEAASLPASTVPKSEAQESGKQISQVMFFSCLSVFHNHISEFCLPFMSQLISSISFISLLTKDNP